MYCKNLSNALKLIEFLLKYSQKLSVFIILALAICSSQAKIYEKCELAKVLNGLGVSKSELPKWLCLIFKESSYNTRNSHQNTDKHNSKDFGLFMINDYYWCKNGNKQSANQCNINCNGKCSLKINFTFFKVLSS